jgi:L-fucose isomerase-like protein
MGFMSLQDEGVPMGCQADLNATLTMMLLKGLSGKPGFMHNVSYNTEKNLYFCAHCTSPSRMNGVDKQSEPYELMNHCESGWGTVPRVLFKEKQEVTIAKYLTHDKKPQFFLYSGEIIDCPPIPPTGGCRTNAETTINELEMGSDLKGRSHMVMFYGHYVKQLKQFCQLYNIEVVV